MTILSYTKDILWHKPSQINILNPEDHMSVMVYKIVEPMFRIHMLDNQLGRIFLKCGTQQQLALLCP